tara:strand:+ start:1568 stop:1849 length:282 start_codon:yes stop_codon:yes gene_type:complete
MLKIDIGDRCTHCGRDTTEDTWNRIPSGTDGILVLTGGNADVRISVQVDGYMCADCQSVQCDICGEYALDYRIVDGEHPLVKCPNCFEKGERA